MLPKEQDTHNLFTPDAVQDFVKCSLEESTVLKIGNKFFNFNTEFSKTDTGVSVRMEFDRWSEFHRNDLSLFGIVPMRPKPKPCVAFETSIVAHNMREIENHGLTYEVVDELCVILPESLRDYLNKKVEVTVKVL